MSYEQGPIPKGKGKVIRDQDGKIYENARAVAREMEVSDAMVSMHLSGKTNSLRGWTFSRYIPIPEIDPDLM